MPGERRACRQCGKDYAASYVDRHETKCVQLVAQEARDAHRANGAFLDRWWWTGLVTPILVMAITRSAALAGVALLVTAAVLAIVYFKKQDQIDHSHRLYFERERREPE